MRRPSVFTRRSDNMDGAMTPMIDVVFLLLVFFVWTASFQIVEQVLPSNMTELQGTSPSDIETPTEQDDLRDITLIVRIYWLDDSAVLELNGTSLATFDELEAELKSKSPQYRQEVPIIIHPDSAVPLGQVIDIYDLARREQFQQIQFAAALSNEAT